MTTHDFSYSTTARLIHLGLAVFGVAAFLTGELAEDGGRSGYLIHAYLGLSLAAVMLLRMGTGFGHSRTLGFRHWRLFSREQWLQTRADIVGLLRFKVPEGGQHRGLSGFVQALGLLIFAWMAASGTVLYLTEGNVSRALFYRLEDFHLLGEGLIPVYLLLHVGAVILHTLVGQPVWQRMFRPGRPSKFIDQ